MLPSLRTSFWSHLICFHTSRYFPASFRSLCAVINSRSFELRELWWAILFLPFHRGRDQLVSHFFLISSSWGSSLASPAPAASVCFWVPAKWANYSRFSCSSVPKLTKDEISKHEAFLNDIKQTRVIFPCRNSRRYFPWLRNPWEHRCLVGWNCWIFKCRVGCWEALSSGSCCLHR